MHDGGNKLRLKSTSLLVTMGCITALATTIFFLLFVYTEVNGHFDAFYLLRAQCNFMEENPNNSPLPCPIPDVEDDLLRANDFDMFGLISVDSRNNHSLIEIYGKGFPCGGPTTAWFVTLPPEIPSSHPIFEYHHRSFPVASTSECYDAGRSGFEANQFMIDHHGNAQFIQHIDFNPLLPFQAPLPNELSIITQESYPPSIGNEADDDFVYHSLQQNVFKSTSILQPIQREFLREFNEDGTQKLDRNGLSVLVKFHLPLFMIPVVVHVDRMTHGVAAGVFDPNILANSDVGDHYELGVFVFGNKIAINRKEKKQYVKRYYSGLKPRHRKKYPE
eukprot:503892_1